MRAGRRRSHTYVAIAAACVLYRILDPPTPPGELLALAEADLDYRRGALLVRRGKGGRRREVGMESTSAE